MPYQKIPFTSSDGVTDDDMNHIQTQYDEAMADSGAALNAHKNAATLDHPDGSVTTAKIANSAVTEAKIANNAVTSNKIASGAVTAGKIANGGVDSLNRIASSIRTSAGGKEANRLAVTDANGAVGLAKDAQAVGGVLASGIARIATGSYVGDGSTSDRLIQVGFAPLMVYVVGNSGADSAGLGLGMAGATHGVAKAASSIALQKQSHGDGQRAPVPTATGFIIRSHDTQANLNRNGTTYTWVAIGAVGA